MNCGEGSETLGVSDLWCMVALKESTPPGFRAPGLRDGSSEPTMTQTDPNYPKTQGVRKPDTVSRPKP